MSGRTRVSVVMPVLNPERYVRQSVESILATGYANLEIVIVDDGSTDATWRILTEIRSGNP
ncbi:MAG TPA: glycosyltransferase [Gemmatimonadota bacterium]|nr:glycosyltransferase [Gemmatimonadota bacterium]